MIFHNPPTTFRGIVIFLIGIMVFTFIFIDNNTKRKNEYERVNGKIIYLDNYIKEDHKKDYIKYRYLKVEGYKYPFELFIGKDFGDFKPKFERIDNLKIGDSVSIFYYENWSTREDGINRFVQYIDKEKESFFVRGNGNSLLGVFLLFSCILFLLMAYILYKRKKIKF